MKNTHKIKYATIFFCFLTVLSCQQEKNEVTRAYELSKLLPDSSIAILDKINVENLRKDLYPKYYATYYNSNFIRRNKQALILKNSDLSIIFKNSNSNMVVEFTEIYSKYLRMVGHEKESVKIINFGRSLCLRNNNIEKLNALNWEINQISLRQCEISNILKNINKFFSKYDDTTSRIINKYVIKGINFLKEEKSDSCKKYLIEALYLNSQNFNYKFASKIATSHFSALKYTYNFNEFKEMSRIVYRNFRGKNTSLVNIPNLKRSNSKKIVPGSPEFLLKKSSNYELDGNYPEALHYFEQYLLAKEQQRVSEVRKNIEEIEARYNNSLLQQENNRIKMRWYTIIGFSISVIFFGVMYYYNKIRHARKILTYNQQFNEKREQISIKALSSRLDMIRTIIKTSKKYQNHPELSTKIKEAIISDAVRNNFLENLDKEVDYNYDGVITRLKNRHPEINQDDIIFCSLIISGFSPRELSILYNYKNEQSLYVKSYRTAQKLGIDISLADYLDQLKTNRQ